MAANGPTLNVRAKPAESPRNLSGTCTAVFEEARLLGPTERSIVVQTRAGTSLANVIDPQPTLQQRSQYGELVRKHGSGWHQRKPPTGGYNCAGHVWASRRTCLTDPGQWRLVLQDDGYRRLPDTEPPVAGDLALYVSEGDEEIIHVARVVEVREGVTPEAAEIPWVVSKWGFVGGEAAHFSHDVRPLQDLGYGFRIEYWTDR